MPESPEENVADIARHQLLCQMQMVCFNYSQKR
jgi:hypothetical protein